MDDNTRDVLLKLLATIQNMKDTIRDVLIAAVGGKITYEIATELVKNLGQIPP